MSINAARQWLIIASISVTGAELIFFLIAPSTGFPLSFPKNLEILQTILPVFLGYLGAAAHFIFKNPAPPVTAQSQFLGIMVKGPVVVYALAVIAALAAFGYSNRIGAAIGTGMSVDNLTTSLAITLGILTATTSVVVSYLFVADPPNR
jgi:hypothetical protein